jgi:hypothetical protein
MILWTIYKYPKDYPNDYVARQFILDQPTQITFIENTYERLIRKLPPGMIRIPRDKTDDPVIVETWI